MLNTRRLGPAACRSGSSSKGFWATQCRSIEEHRHAFDAHKLRPVCRPVVEARDVDGLLALEEGVDRDVAVIAVVERDHPRRLTLREQLEDRKSTRLNSSH